MGEVADRLRSLFMRGSWKEMPKLVEDEMVDELEVSGTAEEVAAAVKERYQGLAGRVSLYAQLDTRTWKRFVTAFRS